MSFEWNHTNGEKLVEEYRSKPEIWNPKNNDYHVQNKKNDAWVSVAEAVGCELNEAKNKMTSLLSSFRREKAKMKNSEGTGKGNYCIKSQI